MPVTMPNSVFLLMLTMSGIGAGATLYLATDRIPEKLKEIQAHQSRLEAQKPRVMEI